MVETLKMIAQGDDCRVPPGPYEFDLENGRVIDCPVPNKETDLCLAMYANCCTAGSPNGIINAPDGSVVGFVCRFRKKTKAINPASYGFVGL